MRYPRSRSSFSLFPASPGTVTGLIFGGALAFTLSFAAWAGQDSTSQQPPAPAAGQAAPQQTAAPEAAPTPPADAQPAPEAPATSSADTPPEQPSLAPSAGPQSAQPAEITEDEVRKLVVGKQLFVRGGYLDNALSYNEHGVLIGHSPQGSYTLSAIQIDKVRLTKHKVELDGERYGLHFLGALPYEDPTKALDRVNITPKKKEVKITIDRELVVKPKQPKGKNKSAKNEVNAAPKPATAASANAAAVPAANPAPQSAPAADQACAPPATPAANQANPQSEPSDAAEAQAEIAAAPPAERPADPNSVTTTTSPAHANKVLVDALDKIFAQGFDARLMDSMPGFWKLYYQAVASKSDYRPADPSVLRQTMVDQKAKLVSNFEPASNQYAQDSGVAGMALYHVVVGSDGKPGEISVARPIGFGLDESAVDSIRKASFSPAIKDGKPVPVLLDLVVEFRIYSKRTNVASAPEASGQSSSPALPGPYSVQHQ
jgi:TonB family protein